MPSLGYHADPRAIAVGMKDMDELGAAQEYLGYWLPKSAQAEAPLIGEGLWRETLIGDEEVPAGFAKVAYGVKFSADGGTVALAVAASNGAAAHVELPFCEPTAGGTKVSLRSNECFDVAAFTAALGGGGHVHAAGCRFALPVAQARDELVRLLSEKLG